MDRKRKSTVLHHFSPFVPLTLQFAGETGVRTVEFKLSFDFNSFALVEAKTGINMLVGMGEFFDNLTCDRLRVAFWAALQIYQQDDYFGDEGLEIIGSYLSFSNASQVRKAVYDAFIASLPADTQKAIRNAEAAALAGMNEPSDAPLVPSAT